MRIIIIIAVIILMASGCDKKDDEGSSKMPESKVANGQEADAIQELKQSPETKIDDSTKKNNLDPVFKDYEYPASKIEDTFSMSNTISAIYKSPDDFAKVVEFYKQKFPDAPPQVGSTAYFGKTNADGSGFTVTLTRVNNNTQIILRLDKKI
jgi:hypothetical protein